MSIVYLQQRHSWCAQSLSILMFLCGLLWPQFFSLIPNCFTSDVVYAQYPFSIHFYFASLLRFHLIRHYMIWRWIVSVPIRVPFLVSLLQFRHSTLLIVYKCLIQFMKLCLGPTICVFTGVPAQSDRIEVSTNYIRREMQHYDGTYHIDLRWEKTFGPMTCLLEISL